MSVLSAQNLAKVYAKKPIVHGVSIEVKQGEVVGLLGPNGAGKTSCFYMIIGLTEQDGGQVTIGEEDISDLPIHGRAERGLSYLPQEPSVFRKLSVKDNILSILEIQKSLSPAQRQNSLERLLEDLNIAAGASHNACACKPRQACSDYCCPMRHVDPPCWITLSPRAIPLALRNPNKEQQRWRSN